MNKKLTQSQLIFRLNGKTVNIAAPNGRRLSEILRKELSARDVKIGCNAGDCGACTVLVDGQPVCACLVVAEQAEEREVQTLTGLHRDDL